MRLLLGVLALAWLSLAGAAFGQSGEVVYYGFAGPHIEPTIKAFNKVYPDIKVRVVTGDTGELTARLEAEKARPRGDVLYGSAAHFLNAPNLFQPYRSQHHDKFPAWSLIKNGESILAYGYNVSIQVLAVNKEQMAEADAPKSWKALLDPKHKGKVLVAHPVLSGAGFQVLVMIIQLYGWDHVPAFIDNVALSSRTNLVPQNVARGEAAAAILEETKAWELVEEGHPLAVIYPEEGVLPATAGIGIIRNGPNPQNATLFAEFLNSQEGHNINVATRNRRVPRIDANPPRGIPPMEKVKVAPVDYDEATRRNDEWLARFDKMLAEKK